MRFSPFRITCQTTATSLVVGSVILVDRQAVVT